MSKLRIGLVGASGFARRFHYPSLQAFDDVEMVALAEPVAERREETAREFDVPRQYASHSEMLEKEDLGAVYVVMSPTRSFDVLREVLAAGVPTFMEKPAVLNAYQGDRLAEVAAKAGTINLVAFNRHFIPVLLEAKRRVEEAGPLSHFTVSYYKHNTEAHYYGGAIDFLHCDAIHAVDALRWLGGGEVRRVQSLVRARESKCFNVVNALVEFANGRTGTLLANWVTALRRHTFEFHGLNRSAFVDPDGVTTIVGADPPKSVELDAAEVAGSDDRRVYYGFEGENRHFVDSVKAGRPTGCDIAWAADTHRLVEEILARSPA